MAAVFETVEPRVLLERPEAVGRLSGAVRVALVALAVPNPAAVVASLTGNGCRVIVYGADDRSLLGAVTRAGAVGFVSDGASAIEIREAVGAAARGTAALFPGHHRGADPARNRFDRRGFDDLTRRERDVLAGLIAGLRPADIARRDFVSVVTVRNQVQSVLTKLNVHSQLEAVAAARWHEWNAAADDEVPTALSSIDASAS